MSSTNAMDYESERTAPTMPPADVLERRFMAYDDILLPMWSFSDWQELQQFSSIGLGAATSAVWVLTITGWASSLSNTVPMYEVPIKLAPTVTVPGRFGTEWNPLSDLQQFASFDYEKLSPWIDSLLALEITPIVQQMRKIEHVLDVTIYRDVHPEEGWSMIVVEAVLDSEDMDVFSDVEDQVTPLAQMLNSDSPPIVLSVA